MIIPIIEDCTNYPISLLNETYGINIDNDKVIAIIGYVEVKENGYFI